MHDYNHAVYICKVFNSSYCPAGIFFVCVGNCIGLFTVSHEIINRTITHYCAARYSIFLGVFQELEDAVLKRKMLPCHSSLNVTLTCLSLQPSLIRRLPSPSTYCTVRFDRHQRRSCPFPFARTPPPTHVRRASISTGGIRTHVKPIMTCL